MFEPFIKGEIGTAKHAKGTRCVEHVHIEQIKKWIFVCDEKAKPKRGNKGPKVDCIITW